MLDITRADYYTEIKRIVDDLEDRYISSDIDDISDALHETIDGHQWVIYTSYCFDVLRHSDNWEYGADEGLIDTKSGSLSDILRAAVYWAMYADVQNDLRSEEELNEAREAREEQTA